MMLFMWIIPLVLVAILTYALMGGRPAAPVPIASTRICANCHQLVQSDWMTCPACGRDL